MSDKKRWLFHFTHGLGDAVQLTVIFQHLKRFRPDVDLYLQALRGKHSVGYGHCQRVWHDREPGPDHAWFDTVYNLAWWECYSVFPDSPSTKACNCLREVFGIVPMPDLSGYRLHVSVEAKVAARQYLESIGCERRSERYNAVVLHYEGNTSSSKKNLNHDQAAVLCATVRGLGYVPVILDWDRRSPLPDQRTIFNPGVHAGDLWGGFGSGDAERIAALVGECSLAVCIDSGPQKCAMASGTPTLAVWSGHHPIQFADLSDTTVHLVPGNWRDVPPASNPVAARYFTEHYRFAAYPPGELTRALSMTAADMLQGSLEERDGLVRVGRFWLRKDNLDQDMVIVRDIYHADAYRTHLLPIREPHVMVDIGAHIGTFAARWKENNPLARIICVEACPENLEALRSNVGDFAEIVHAACTYEDGPVALLNAVRPNCESTGGSIVVPLDTLEAEHGQAGYRYWQDRRELPTVTLEDLMRRFGFDRIDLLKLDCEGSEYSILGKTPSLARIRTIAGEYHGRERWEQFRAERFAGWSYGHMHDAGDPGGNFHLANPTWPPAEENRFSDISEYYRGDLARAEDDAWGRSGEYRRNLEAVRNACERYGLSSVLEVGCGSGRLAAELPAELEYLGVDANGEFVTLARGRAGQRFIQADVRRFVPDRPFDLVCAFAFLKHFGLHEWDDVVARVCLLSRYAVLEVPLAFSDVDDGKSFHHVWVTRARFERVLRLAGKTILDERKVWGGPEGTVSLFTIGTVLRIAVPAGIGDTLWVMAKVPAMLNRERAERVAVTVCQDQLQRAGDFLRAFDFVESVDYCDLSVLEEPAVIDGLYNYAPSQPHWHNRFDWFLQANGHLERGRRLEEWLPELEIDWNIAKRFRFTQAHLAYADAMRLAGPYAVFYLGPESGNTVAGHNRGPLWRPEQWGELADGVRGFGLRVVVVGAAYDRSYFEMVRSCLGEVQDAIGQWEIGQTFAVIQLAACVVAYQSGIGIFAPYLGVPTACFWRPYGDSISPHAYVSFDERMAAAWAPPEALTSGLYLPLIYGRCEPDSILQWMAGTLS